MTRVAFAEAVMDDFARIAAQQAQHGPAATTERLSAIVAAIDVLQVNPRIGRPAEEGRRELVIGQGSGGYLALYAFIEEVDTVLVLALRSQREAAYTRP